MNRYAVELAHLTALDLDPARFAALAARAGFDSVSLRLSPVAPGAVHYRLPAASQELRATRAAIAEAGLTVSGIEIVSLSPDLDVTAIEPLLETGAEFAAKGLCVTGDDPDHARIADTFARLCELARGFGIGVDLEFMRWRPVATLSDAAAIVAAAGAPNGFIMLDVLHLIRSGGTPAEVAATDPALFRCVQLCDAHAQLPRHLDVVGEARGGRLPIGEGALPLADIVAALPRHVVWSAELPLSPAANGDDLDAALARSRRRIGDLIRTHAP